MVDEPSLNCQRHNGVGRELLVSVVQCIKYMSIMTEYCLPYIDQDEHLYYAGGICSQSSRNDDRKMM